MTDNHLLIVNVVSLVALVVIVFLLKDKIFKIKVSKKALAIDSQPPPQRPGVVVDGAVSRQGTVKVENNVGDGVKAGGLDGAQDVSVTNNSPPKS